ncbi:NADH-quinone oxidoreductase subunit NuoE [Tissierella sp. Yu-01]|uniref:NADH-quinone oxidoreductase subunit NuoE n=1 Tax=Tissierella sp. Yu-01 TaxID=3035694 RepID=UPI00240D9A38|nr:NADH-quinone oxidoreductase subunit NuoE [Tissierella sp. Yu-01]WFA08768.1 NADH-quinone oxidoreductase subunit NuoE [Tissierella sp. Yu-01]
MSLEIIKKYPNEKRFTLAILQDIQREYSYIPREYMESIAEYLNLPLSDVYSLATFYKALSLKPKGKYTIKVCDGTACHIRDSKSILNELLEVLEIEAGETTEDGLFSVEVVNCIGACALAPVILINDKYYGSMTKEKVKNVLDSYREVSTNE